MICLQSKHLIRHHHLILQVKQLLIIWFVLGVEPMAYRNYYQLL